MKARKPGLCPCLVTTSAFSPDWRLLIHVEENIDNLLRPDLGQYLHLPSKDGCASADQALAGDKGRKRLQVFNQRGPDLGRRKLPESGVVVVLVVIPYQHDVFNLVS